MTQRTDSLVNAMARLGGANDVRAKSNFVTNKLSDTLIDTLLESSSIARKFCDIPGFWSLKEGFEIHVKDNEEISLQVNQAMTSMGANQILRKAMYLARAYGGAGIILGLEDGKNTEEPVDFTRLTGKTIKYTLIIDRFKLKIIPESLQVDPELPYFNEYTQLELNNASKRAFHIDRVIKFEGAYVRDERKKDYDYWSPSYLQLISERLTDYETSVSSVAKTILDHNFYVHKIKDLASKMMSDEGRLALEKRFEALTMIRALSNAMVVDAEGEAVENTARNVSGMPELFDRVEKALVIASEFPHTILLGESPSGLGATGDSEKIQFYDYIKSQQQDILQPAIRKLVKVVLSTLGAADAEFDIVFNPIDNPTLQDEMAARKTVAEADKIYIESGVITPDMVARARFGQAEFGYELRLSAEELSFIDGSNADSNETDSAE